MQSIERFACDQHDHVSFAKAWMLMSKGVARALDDDFRLVPPAVMAPLQRGWEGGLRQTMSVLLGSEVSDLAWERAKLPRALGVWASCSDGLCGISIVLVGCRLAQGCNDEHVRRTDRYASRILRSQPLWWLQRQICSYRVSLLTSMPE